MTDRECKLKDDVRSLVARIDLHQEEIGTLKLMGQTRGSVQYSKSHREIESPVSNLRHLKVVPMMDHGTKGLEVNLLEQWCL